MAAEFYFEGNEICDYLYRMVWQVLSLSVCLPTVTRAIVWLVLPSKKENNLILNLSYTFFICKNLFVSLP